MEHVAGIVSNNSFRIVGLKGTATQKEIEKQKSKAASFARIGREVALEFQPALDLPDVARGEEDLAQAFARLQRGGGRVRHALF